MMRARDNPFGAERMLQLRYQFRASADRDGWPTLLLRLEALNYRAAIVGPRGSGKTTLLEDLEAHLTKLGFHTHHVRLNEQQRKYPSEFIRRLRAGSLKNDIILFDGCEQLGPFNWYRFCWWTRRTRGLIITTHHVGRLPLLRRCETNPELLHDLIKRLGGSNYIHESEISPLYHSHHGNLREALRELYDIAFEIGPQIRVTPPCPIQEEEQKYVLCRNGNLEHMNGKT